MDINEAISDEAVLVDALTLKNKMLMVQVAQLQAHTLKLKEVIEAHEDEIVRLKGEVNAKPKPKKRTKK
jgi:hypothetical protein